MAFGPFESAKRFWSTATPKQQKTYMIGGVAAVILIAAFTASQFTPKGKPKPVDKRTDTTVMLPQRKDLTAESLQSQMAALQNQVRDIMAYLRSVDNNVKTANDNINAKIDQKLEDVVSSKTLQEKIERAVEGKVLEANEKNGTGATGPGGPGGVPAGMRIPAGMATPGPSAPLPSYGPGGPMLPEIGPPGRGGVDALTGDKGAAGGDKDDAPGGAMHIGGRAGSKDGGSIKIGSGGTAGNSGGASLPGSGSGATLTPVDANGHPINPNAGGVKLGKIGMPAPNEGGPSSGPGTVTSSQDAGSRSNMTDRDIADTKQGNEVLTLTAGAIFSGVLLNGMDAPTSQAAQKNPTPVVIRIKHEAILPNFYKSDVRECFVLAGGYGSMSTERANMRTETLTCITVSGKILEGKLDGYVVGEDGKVGMRGRLVTKQGAAIANAMVAGILSGIGNVMAQSVTNGTTVASGGFFASTATASDVLTNGAYQGVGNALNTVAKFYTDMAKDMFPVVEVDPGRFATIILIKGINLRPKGGA